MIGKLTLPNNSAMLSQDFTYGVATASFQIEGGIESRLPCIWDTFCSKPNTIIDKSNGNLACDHFNLWQQDIELIAALGVDATDYQYHGHGSYRNLESLIQKASHFISLF
jgi:beta-glucosidase